ncbi:hypothetical protein EWI07_10985 [Sporolactobacillus sp. THM7-4]|nr:hypothetical protein EWI07_10985 [Sporolactobacillus sp. THM7-4]
MRFNPHITINGIKVGGLTAEDALKRLKTLTLKNEVYVGDKLVFNGKNTKTRFTDKDLPEVRILLGRQRTWWPSSREKNYRLIPVQADRYRSQTLKGKVAEKLKFMNRSLKAPSDAQAHLEHGKITVSKSKPGEQYDVVKLLKDFDQHEYDRIISLKPVFLQPVKENSQTVRDEKKKLQELIRRTVNYKVQNKVYPLAAGQFIQNATVSRDMKISIDSSNLKNKVAAINRSQSTLNKNFTFRTHSGSIISVKGESYGWALNVDAETKRIQNAFEQGEKMLSAYNVYGVGYSTYGIGYHQTENHGIGNTYAEVSIKEQRIWIYKNGQLKITTRVVTGRHDTHEDTPKGLWYIMYKQSPSTLEGSEAGNPHYSVKVSYWAPFTLSGCGFHDAGWRSNWAADAYLRHGSGGCVNTPPKVMKTVYDNLSQNEPVVIY